MEVKLVPYGSNAYTEMVSLRTEILRKPLGISFTKEQLEKEKDDWLVCAFEQENVIGCCILSPKDKQVLQLRQMAVSGSSQHKGVGRQILAFAELHAKNNNFKVVLMHARDVALGFYEKCGYQVVGEAFTEVGLPHHKMEKKL
ncbi:MAG: GNAT family N-acetyltransferase [Terrimonas sp.]|nr:GNAT family N-acetyltransferase [Terrimonas sp.]